MRMIESRTTTVFQFFRQIGPACVVSTADQQFCFLHMQKVGFLKGVAQLMDNFAYVTLQKKN